MSLIIATVTPFAAYLSADSAFYGGNAAAVADMEAAAAGRCVAPQDLTPIKPAGFAPRVISVPNRPLAMTWSGGTLPGVSVAATAWEARLSFDLLNDAVTSLWGSLPAELRALPLFMVAVGYSDKAQRMAGLSALTKGGGIEVQMLPPGTHSIQPLPPLQEAVEARWQDAAHGLHVEAFHRDVAEAATMTWRDRIGGELQCAKVTRAGVTMSTLSHLGGMCTLEAVAA